MYFHIHVKTFAVILAFFNRFELEDNKPLLTVSSFHCAIVILENKFIFNFLIELNLVHLPLHAKIGEKAYFDTHLLLMSIFFFKPFCC